MQRMLLLALALLVSAPADALVFISGDGQGNNTPPPDDPGWDHVGRVGGLNGIYLGNGWRYFAPEAWREGVPAFFSLSFLPQFGGLHIHALGLVKAMAPAEHTWVALLNCGAWTVGAALAGAWLFSRKRL